MKNFPIYVAQTRGPHVGQVLTDIFLEAIQSSHQAAVRIQAADNLIYYLERLVGDTRSLTEEYGAVFNEVFRRMQDLPEAGFFLFASSYYSLQKMGICLVANRPAGFEFGSYCSLLQRCLVITYQYWLGLEDPQQWFQKQAGEWWDPEVHSVVFSLVSHERLRELERDLAKIAKQEAGEKQARELTALPD